MFATTTSQIAPFPPTRRAFTGMIFGLRLTLTCPICEEPVELIYQFGAELTQAISEAAARHREMRCASPAEKWMPEQLGYTK